MKTKDYKLDNGLKIVVREDHRAPVVVAQIWYRVGSGDEHNGITGISHALEHMMFKGTKEHPGDAYSKIISQNGGQDNAFTTDDYTAYYAELDTSKLELSLKLEADRMQNLIIDPDLFEQEQKVVMEERRMRTEDNPLRLTYERFQAAANIAGPYHHPVIGWMHDINQLTAKDLTNWYQNWYGPNNATLVIVGNVEADKVFELAKKYFAPIKKKAKRATKTYTEIPALGETRISVKAPAKLPYLIMGFSVPSAGSLKQETENQYEPYALMVASALLDGGNSSRFAKNLVRGKEVAVDASAYYEPFKRHGTQFVMTGIPTERHTTSDLEKAFWDQIHVLQTELTPEEELKKVKTQIIADEIFEKDSMSEQAYLIGMFESIGLRWQDSDAYVSRIKEITAQQVQTVAKKYFHEDRLTVATLIPQPMEQEGV